MSEINSDALLKRWNDVDTAMCYTVSLLVHIVGFLVVLYFCDNTAVAAGFLFYVVPAHFYIVHRDSKRIRERNALCVIGHLLRQPL